MWPWRRTAARVVAEPPPVVAARRREWADLPPLQRAIGEHPLVDPPGRFAGELASWQNPGFLGPLGHISTPDEPSGMVEGIAVAPALPVAAGKRAKGPVARVTAFAQRWAAESPARPAAEDQPTPEPSAADEAVPELTPESGAANDAAAELTPESGAAGNAAAEFTPRFGAADEAMPEPSAAAELSQRLPTIDRPLARIRPAENPSVQRSADPLSTPTGRAAQPPAGEHAVAPDPSALSPAPRLHARIQRAVNEPLPRSRHTTDPPIQHTVDPSSSAAASEREVDLPPLPVSEPPTPAGIQHVTNSPPPEMQRAVDLPLPLIQRAVDLPSPLTQHVADLTPPQHQHTPDSQSPPESPRTVDLPSPLIQRAADSTPPERHHAPDPQSPTESPHMIGLPPPLVQRAADSTPPERRHTPNFRPPPESRRTVDLPPTPIGRASDPTPPVVQRATDQPSLPIRPAGGPAPSLVRPATGGPLQHGAPPALPPAIQRSMGPPPIQQGGAEPLEPPAETVVDLPPPPAVPAATRPPAVQRTTLGDAPVPRRLGLGAPIVPPPTPSAEPAAPTRLFGPTHAGSPTVPQLQRAEVPLPTPATPATAAQPADADSPTLGGTPLTVARAVQHPDDTIAQAVQEGRPPPASGQRRIATTPVVVARLLADRPLAPTLQRTAPTTPEPDRSATPPLALQRFDSPPLDQPAAVPRATAAVLTAYPSGSGATRPTAQLDAGSAGATTIDIPAAAPAAAPAPAGGPDESTPATTTSAPPPPTPAAPVPEELLKTLFEPLYRRLRAELRKDRDRRGLITDLRR